jgi:hypothetical protein
LLRHLLTSQLFGLFCFFPFESNSSLESAFKA